jgi:hypothetical protein
MPEHACVFLLSSLVSVHRIEIGNEIILHSEQLNATRLHILTTEVITFLIPMYRLFQLTKIQIIPVKTAIGREERIQGEDRF